MIRRFGEFTLDEDRLELRRSGAIVPLQALPFKLLSTLIELRGQVVSKRTLIERVWDGSVVSDTAIAQAVMLVRKALGDEKQALITTVRGRGFRFTASIEALEVALESASVAAPPAACPAPGPADPRPSASASMDAPATLAAAALLGQRFAVPVLAALMDRPEYAILDELEPALRQGLLKECTGPGQCEFVDERIRAELYAAIPNARRAAWHQRAGELLEQRRLDARSVEELAHHFARAGTSTSRQRAVAQLRRAADAADAAGTHVDAARMLDRAVEIAELDPAEPETHYALLECAGHAWYRAGQLKPAAARFERSLELARWQSDGRRAARAIMNVFIAERMTLFQHATQRRLREELCALPQADEAVAALAQAAAALVDHTGKPTERASATALALDRARRTGEEFCIEAALRIRHLTLLEFAHPRELCAVMDEFISESRATGDRESLLDGLLSRTAHAAELGDLPLAIRDRTEYLVLHASCPSPIHRYLGRVAEAADNAMAGRVELAVELSEQAAALGSDIDPGAQLHDEIRRLLYYAHHGVGQPEMADRALEQVPPDYRPFWSLVWAREGRSEDARRVIRHFAQAGFPPLASGGPQRAYLAIVGEVSALLGERQIAEDVYARLLPSEGLHLALYTSGVYLGPVALYLALCASSCGRDELVRRHFEDALEQTLAIGALPCVVRVRRAFAQWLNARGEAHPATSLERAADHLARGIGLPCDVPRLPVHGNTSARTRKETVSLQALRRGLRKSNDN